MGNNLQLVTEDIAGGLCATLVVDCLDYGGEVILTDLFRAEVPVELSSRRVGVVSVVGGVGVSFGALSFDLRRFDFQFLTERHINEIMNLREISSLN